MVLLLLGIGPPGVQPPLTFQAEQWYPSNLPTVMPPWKLKVADVRNVQVPQTSTTPGFVETETESFLSTGFPLNLTGDMAAETESDNTTLSATTDASKEPPQIREEVSNGFEDEEKTSSVPETVFIISTESAPVTDFTSSRTPIGEESGADLSSTVEASDSTKESSESTMRPPSQASSEVPTPDKSNCTDIFLLLDSSGNVLRQYEKQKHLINNILIELGDGDRHYGLMTYAGKTRQRMNVPPHSQISKQLFMKKLAKARFLSGVTATGSALKAVASLKFSHSTDIIVVTDGFSFDSVDKEAEQLSFVQSNNAVYLFFPGIFIG
ncbi:von Willebrand factor type A domain protein [Ancylostoma duodenale]|uniref:von Willebrand factor type A domain protein n=1 Tax=Ancylostoma duodenale TaxID=51022 RepID=A0A0C2DGN7_9BILA|nr:von Willebrand factor type A domain protein [Ancylostoma duodenale]